MKRILTCFIVATLLLGCSKDENNVIASYRFVSDETSSTKATISENHAIIWEDGDEVSLTVKIIPENAEMIILDGGSTQKPSKVVDAKLVYENGVWSVFEYSGTWSKQVDVLSIAMPSDDYYVTFNYQYEKKMELSAGWFNKVKFQAGVQDIPVHGVLQQ